MVIGELLHSVELRVIETPPLVDAQATPANECSRGSLTPHTFLSLLKLSAACFSFFLLLGEAAGWRRAGAAQRGPVQNHHRVTVQDAATQSKRTVTPLSSPRSHNRVCKDWRRKRGYNKDMKIRNACALSAVSGVLTGATTNTNGNK